MPAPSLLVRTAQLLRPHARPLLAAAALAALLSLCKGSLIWLIRALLDTLSSSDPTEGAPPLAVAVVGLFLVQGLIRVGRTWLTRRAALAAEIELRQRLFEHYLRRDPAQLSEEGQGDALARLSHDAGRIRPAVGAAVTAVQRPLTALALAGSAAAMAPKLALLALIGVPVVLAVITFAGAGTRRAAQAHLRALSRFEATAKDLLAGLRTLQAVGGEGAAAAELGLHNREQARLALRSTLYRTASSPAVEMTAALAVAAVVLLGAAEISAGTLEPGALVAFLVALGLLNEPLKGIADVHGLWQEARAGLERVYEALDRPPAVVDAAGAVALPEGPVTIELADVWVDRGRGPVLRGVDLELVPGEIVAISGPSGAGKSTLIDVVARFVSPSAGSLRWNGRGAEHWTVGSLRRQLALVEQRPWLGSGSIAEAIALGAPGSSRGAIEAAAQGAGLRGDSGLLATLPGGLDAQVGDGGGAISGGELQRIALARALLRDAPLLLLDEPTANLDEQAEGAFLRTLLKLAPGRTVLLVSHRPAPLAIADRHYLLREGRLVQQRQSRGVA